MNSRFLIVMCLSAIFVFAGCGTTQLVVMNNPSAEIYVNGAYKGKGIAAIQRAGPPKKSEIIAKYQGREIGSITIGRKFDFVSFLAGYYSFGAGFILCLRYPATVFIPSDTPEKSNTPSQSPWDQPPGAWDKK